MEKENIGRGMREGRGEGEGRGRKERGEEMEKE